MTRTTEATDDQITAAALEYWTRTSNVPWDKLSQSHREVVIRKITDAAELAVRPDERIVAVADLKRILQPLNFPIDEVMAAIERITALIGDET